MNNSIIKILTVTIILLSTIPGFSQIKNVKTAAFKVYGNCGMCKTTIEKAGNDKRTASVAWNKDTKMAILTYDSKQTNQDAILKRIALAGYDNEKFRAPDEVYAKLPACCQYDRAIKPVARTKDGGANMKIGHDGHQHSEVKAPETTTVQKKSILSAVFDDYFLIKDALVKADPGMASLKAANLLTSIKAVEMDKLATGEHTIWMKIKNALNVNAAHISKSKDIAAQRTAFAVLSQNIYELAKASGQDLPVYYQHCPMYNDGKGAYWLSKENAVKNPYYGSRMLTCGNTVETIGK